MKIVDIYSLNDAFSIIESQHPEVLSTIEKTLDNIKLENTKKVISKERKIIGREFISQRHINDMFSKGMNKEGWYPKRISLAYEDLKTGYREIDFYKEELKIGIEFQFGKYSFMAYDILSKMPLFNNKGLLELGIEIIPSKNLRENICSGIGHFNQLKHDLDNLGKHCHDIPVLILGVDFLFPHYWILRCQSTILMNQKRY